MSSDGSTEVAPRRHVSTREAAFIGVGAMVGAGIFSLLGTAGEVAGTAVWLSFVLAGIIAALQGYSFGKLGAIFPSGGGLLEYVNRGYGPGHIATVTAWLTYAANGIVTAMVAVSFGQLCERRVQQRRPDLGEAVRGGARGGDDPAEHRRFVVRRASPEPHRLRGRGHPRVLRRGHDAGSGLLATRPIRLSEHPRHRVQRRPDVLRLPRLRCGDVHRQGSGRPASPAAAGHGDRDRAGHGRVRVGVPGRVRDHERARHHRRRAHGDRRRRPADPG